MVTIFTAPPIAPEPYNVPAEPPLMISILSMESMGMFDKFTLDISISFNRIPLTKINELDLDASPNPLMSNDEFVPPTPS